MRKQNEEEVEVEQTVGEEIEEIFKSEVKCEECNGTGLAKGGTGTKLGNERDPHKGGKTGSKVKPPRGGRKAPTVDRDAAGKSPVTKKSMANFPMNSNPQVVSYAMAGDSDLAKSIEALNKGERSDLYVGSQRNLQMEQASNRQRKDREQNEEG